MNVEQRTKVTKTIYEKPITLCTKEGEREKHRGTKDTLYYSIISVTKTNGSTQFKLGYILTKLGQLTFVLFTKIDRNTITRKWVNRRQPTRLCTQHLTQEIRIQNIDTINIDNVQLKDISILSPIYTYNTHAPLYRKNSIKL